MCFFDCARYIGDDTSAGRGKFKNFVDGVDKPSKSWESANYETDLIACSV